MAASIRDDEDDKPLDPAVERVRRRLMRFMVINLAILFAALIAVVAALVYKSRSSDASRAVAPPAVSAAAPQGDGAIVLPAGARVLSQSLSGDSLSLHVALADGESEAIMIYSLAEGRIVATLPVRPQ